MKNLIRYSESVENSLSPMLHQILPRSMSSGSNFNLKMAYFDPWNMRFSQFFEISSQTTCHIPVKFGTMIAPKFPKTLQKTALSYLSYFWLFFRSKMAKIAKMTLEIYWMIQKILSLDFFWKWSKMVQFAMLSRYRWYLKTFLFFLQVQVFLARHLENFLKIFHDI